ncbi:MAG: DUF3883 domain-containing protein [Burkholderiales bacterium]
MNGADWGRREVEAIVDDYLSMLASELAGTPYNKAAHRRLLLPLLDNRSAQSVEYKHANISAALLDLGFPYINGYKPRSNYQTLLAEVVAERLYGNTDLLQLAASDADRPIAVPEVDDILSVLVKRSSTTGEGNHAREPVTFGGRPALNYIEREARNRSLGSAGERFVINYERARLIRAGRDALAARIEHTSQVRGDYEGYDILSFEETGAERLIEVKTTKYGGETPFFVTRNEVRTSEYRAGQYQLYRLFTFRDMPRLFLLPGAIPTTCRLSAASFLAEPR